MQPTTKSSCIIGFFPIGMAAQQFKHAINTLYCYQQV